MKQIIAPRVILVVWLGIFKSLEFSTKLNVFFTLFLRENYGLMPGWILAFPKNAGI
jgi:hypothetical protein